MLEPIVLEGPAKQGLSKLVGHDVQIDLTLALGVSSYMPDSRLMGFDVVTIEIKSSRSGYQSEFIPLIRVLSIHHAQSCRTEGGNYCKGE